MASPVVASSDFSRIKTIVHRLRDIFKCQKCLQLKDEYSTYFYYTCDHFFCSDCIREESRCLVCSGELDVPRKVLTDKNILSLYHSLAKFELPSKQDLKNIMKSLDVSEKKCHNKNSDINISNPEHEFIGAPVRCKSNLTNLKVRKNDQNNEREEQKEKKQKTMRNKEGEDIANKTENLNSFKEWKKSDSYVTIEVRPPSITSSLRTTTSLKEFKKNSNGNFASPKLNVNKRNPKGETPLHLACKKSNFEAMQKLIAAGADPNAQDNAGWTALHDSVFSGNIEVIKFLLDNGAKVNVPGLENTTALHEAIAKGNLKIIKILLDYGANIEAMNIFRETPLDLVTKYKLEEIKEMLVQSSVDGKERQLRSVVEESEENICLFKYELPPEEEKLVDEMVEKFNVNIIFSLPSKVPPTHIIVSDNEFTVKWTLVSCVPFGSRIVTMDWVRSSLREGRINPVIQFEPPKSLISGFARARINKQNQLPGLFSGCHFFFGGHFDKYFINNLTVGKEELKILVENHGGTILKRSPDPESLSLEKTLPFHAASNSSLCNTSHFIIYQTEKWDPKPKYNMSHMKTLPVDWLVACVYYFELIDPRGKETFCEFTKAFDSEKNTV